MAGGERGEQVLVRVVPQTSSTLREDRLAHQVPVRRPQRHAMHCYIHPNFHCLLLYYVTMYYSTYHAPRWTGGGNFCRPF